MSDNFPKEVIKRGPLYVLRPREEGCTVHTRILGASDRIPDWFGEVGLFQVLLLSGVGRCRCEVNRTLLTLRVEISVVGVFI